MSRFRATFSALGNRNYRIYFIGHSVSTVGEWMQRIGQAWLVLELSGSGTLLGLTAALQHLPMLAAGPWGGLLADRVDKRTILLWTQCLAGLVALLLAILTMTGRIELWMVLLLAFLHGGIVAFDNPARHSIVVEMVGKQDLTNAIMLESIVFNAAKAVGPALAGVLIASVGLAASFFANSGSYFAVVVALLLLRTSEWQPSVKVLRGRGQLREGIRYVRQRPLLAGTLVLMAISGMMAYEWAVTLPLLAQDAFDGDSATFGLMFSAMGLGAVLGGLIVASRLRPTIVSLLVAGSGFSGLMLMVALSPTLNVALVGLVALGGASIAFRSLAKSILQIHAAPHMRGRVMALLAVALSGTTPLGAPLVGWIGEHGGSRLAIALGGGSTAAAIVYVWVRLRRSGSLQRD